ncbi:hypothetical protein D9757_004509 [Collybiopsis confluens]|uniref:Transmembrane protein n=1 Tax=Collybiopsis confluens TaxID=2823264 RepID=A0A8H5MEF4_9AGAR|nr:hypothetical protein D9757_004509 [Collybiopsis confluens]
MQVLSTTTNTGMEEPLLVLSRRLYSPDSYVHRDHARPETVSGGSENVQDVQGLPPQRTHRDGDVSSRPYLGTTGIRGRYWEILSLSFLAALIACMNHFIFAHMDGKEAGSHTRQFWVTVLKNVFPAAVAFLLFASLNNCLSQVALYHIRLDSHPLGAVNFMASPPSLLNIFSTLFKSSGMRSELASFAFLTATTQAAALASLFVPGTLSVAPSPPHTQTLEVPTIDLNLVDPSRSVINATTNLNSHALMQSPSQKWQQLVLRAALSNTAPGWDPPAGCGSACSYMFSYSAPALKCTQLSKEDIWPSGMNASSSHLLFDAESYTFYNSTNELNVDNYNSSNNNFTLEVVYLDHFNSSAETRDILRTGVINPQQWSSTGAHCRVQSATYQAKVTFSNNTQLSSTHVKEWGNSTSFMFENTNIGIAANSIVVSFADILSGSAHYDLLSLLIYTTNTRVIDSTVLFNTTGNNSDLTFFDFTLSPALGNNLATGLQDFFGNITLAFVNERMATTFVEASVTPNSTQYQYVGWRLGSIYGIVFAFSFVVIAYGLFCLQKNGTFAVFDVQHIVEMTATSTRLHAAATHPEFGSTLVKGVFSSELNGARRRIVVLEVCD